VTERGIDKARRELAESKAKGDVAKTFENFTKVLDMATKLKKVMLKRGLTTAKARCDLCEGYLYGTLAGHKNHLHMRCDGPCKSFFME
jgi:hypothetical protein